MSTGQNATKSFRGGVSYADWMPAQVAHRRQGVRMRGKLALLGTVAVFGVFALPCRGEASRVAVIDFSLTEAEGSRDPEIVNFSRDVQARLLVHSEFAWIERQEFDRIEQEVDRGGLAQTGATAAVRLGHWLHADLLVRGEITGSAPGKGELTIEVIDLKRAEVVGSRKVPVTVNPWNLVRPVAADADRAAATALSVLKESQEILERNRAAVVIAPLYFRNTGITERLNYLEGRLTDAITQTAARTPAVRVLQFPRTSAASGESELVVAGLTDSDPDAWQQVADWYVWGTFTEGKSEGVAFEDAPVTVSAMVWGGAGSPREVRWEGPVRNLDQGLGVLSKGILDLARDRPAAAARTDRDRKRVANQLRRRASEVKRQIDENENPQGGVSRDFSISPEGRNLVRYYGRLLDLACFFDPLNPELQMDRLLRSWREHPLTPAETLRLSWRRFGDYQSYARRFEHRPDGSFDWKLRETTTGILEGILGMIERSRSGRPDAVKMTPEENLRQFRLALGLWCQEVSAANRPLVGQALPEGFESFDRARIDYLRDFIRRDAIVARKALEEVWPWLKKAVGKELHENRDSNYPYGVISVYAAFGDLPRATQLLDEAWNAADRPPVATASANPPGPPALPPKPEKPWLFAQQPVSGTSMTKAPPLNASVRELDLWPRYEYSCPYRDRPIVKRPPGVTSLVWHRGALWIGQAVPETVSEAARPYASNNYLWRYDPALQTKELVTRELHAHSAVRVAVSRGDQLWLGMDSEGVWQLSAEPGKVRQFRAEDGVASPRIFGAAAEGKSLDFAGGNRELPTIARYASDTGSWSALPAPSPLRFGMGALAMGTLPKITMAPYAPEIAIFENWLAEVTPIPAFYNLSTKTWIDLPGTPSGDPARPLASRICSSLSADEGGFWLGFENEILQFDPRAPEKMREIPLPGTPIAAADEGTRLWLILETATGQSLLALLDKGSGQCAGRLELPEPPPELPGGAAVWRADAIPTTRYNKIAIAGGRVWIGGPRLLEVTLRTVAPAAAGAGSGVDHPLFRAAWRGDFAAAKTALATKPDCREATASGWTPLLAAVDGGNEEVVRLLLGAGADPNCLSRDGLSPLGLASARGDLGLVRLLLGSGAKPDLIPAAGVRGLTKHWLPVEPLTPNLEITTPPSQPANVRATTTETGDVVLSWENRSNNESFFEIDRCDLRGYPLHAIARVPAGAVTWTDEMPPRGVEVGYRVLALNGAPRTTGYEDEPSLWVETSKPEWVFDLRMGDVLAFPPIIECQTPLMAAAGAGHLDMIQALMAAKASLDLRDPVGQTALLLAVRAGRYEAARALLAAGAHADVPDGNGRTAAQVVYERHDDESLWRETLQSLEGNRRARETSRLLQLAAGDGQLHDLDSLRELGATVDGASEYGGTALSLAIASGQSGAARWLLDHGFSLTKKIRTPSGISTTAVGAAAAAVAKGKQPDLTLLLDSGISVNETIDGLPLLALAAQSGNRDAVALLIQRGADQALKSRQGGLPISYASTEAVKALFAHTATDSWLLPTNSVNWLTCGPSVNPPAPDPAKANVNARLLAACQKNDFNGVALAVADGAQMDFRDPSNEFGRTPLVIALKAHALQAARWLVENGAEANLATGKGYVPLSFAILTRDSKMVDCLLHAGADPNGNGHGSSSPLMTAGDGGSLESAARLLDAGADPNLASWTADGYREPPLAVALLAGNTPMVDLLLSRGANPRAQGFDMISGDGGRRPNPWPSLLMYAASGGKMDLVRKMIAAGQDPRFATLQGLDALAWASGRGQDEVVKYLLPLVGPSPHAMEMANSHGHASTVELLRKAGYE
jgi:ankyrin repeat protein